MSELNNKKDKIFLLVLIYLIMAILITTFAIIFHQKNGIGKGKLQSIQLVGFKNKGEKK